MLVLGCLPDEWIEYKFIRVESNFVRKQLNPFATLAMTLNMFKFNDIIIFSPTSPVKFLQTTNSIMKDGGYKNLGGWILNQQIFPKFGLT